MKTIDVTRQSPELNALLEEAKQEDVLLRLDDGSEFMVVAIDDFDWEIARTRKNDKLMALLDERAQQTETISLDALKQELGL